MNNQETFYGKVENTKQAFALLTACINGKVPMLTRRLTTEEREQIRIGSVFVFEERESNIQRWTDGRLWSSSRYSGTFSMQFNETFTKKLCRWFYELLRGRTS